MALTRKVDGWEWDAKRCCFVPPLSKNGAPLSPNVSQNPKAKADFLGLVDAYQATNNVSKGDAMSAVAAKFPKEHRDYLAAHNIGKEHLLGMPAGETQSGGTKVKTEAAGETFEELVEGHMWRWGSSKAMAMQKVSMSHPKAHRAWLAKFNPNCDFLREEA